MGLVIMTALLMAPLFAMSVLMLLFLAAEAPTEFRGDAND